MIAARGVIAIFEIGPGLYAGCEVVAWSDDREALCIDHHGHLAPAKARTGFVGVIVESFLMKKPNPLDKEAEFRRMLGIEASIQIRRATSSVVHPGAGQERTNRAYAAMLGTPGELYLHCPTLPTEIP